MSNFNETIKFLYNEVEKMNITENQKKIMKEIALNQVVVRMFESKLHKLERKLKIAMREEENAEV
jgi:hypothetical protein